MKPLCKAVSSVSGAAYMHVSVISKVLCLTVHHHAQGLQDYLPHPMAATTPCKTAAPDYVARVSIALQQIGAGSCGCPDSTHSQVRRCFHYECSEGALTKCHLQHTLLICSIAVLPCMRAGQTLSVAPLSLAWVLLGIRGTRLASVCPKVVSKGVAGGPTGGSWGVTGCINI